MFARTHNRHRRPSGFTLIELIVTVSLVGVLAAIATPAFTTMIANTRVKGSSSNLHMLLLKARSEAVKRNTSVLVSRVGSDWDAGVWNLTWDDPATAATTQITLASEAQPRGVTITPSPGPASVTYLRSGRISGAAPAFTIVPVNAPQAASRCVSVGLSGIPTVKKAAC